MTRLTLITVIVFCIHNSCKDDKSDPEPVAVQSISYKGCNETKSGNVSKSSDCIKYQFIDNKYLKISRSNVSFNCAADSLVLNIKQSGNSIEIDESGHYSLAANCNCLHSFEYSIGPLDPKSYTITINEEYGSKMTFDIDLAKIDEGEYCEERTGYPYPGY